MQQFYEMFAKHLMLCLLQSKRPVNDTYYHWSITVSIIMTILWDSSSLLLPNPTFFLCHRTIVSHIITIYLLADGWLSPRALCILSPPSLKCYGGGFLCGDMENPKA